jgi:hypothetical protein
VRFLTWCSTRVPAATLFAAALAISGAAVSTREPQVGLALMLVGCAASLVAIGAWVVPLVADPWRAPRGRRRRH